MKVYDSSYQPKLYSQELANGDSADDRDIHEDEDMKDDVVDYMGQTNAGYGSRNMEWFHAHNTIDESAGPGHFLTDPGFWEVWHNFKNVEKYIHPLEDSKNQFRDAH